MPGSKHRNVVWGLSAETRRLGCRRFQRSRLVGPVGGSVVHGALACHPQSSPQWDAKDLGQRFRVRRRLAAAAHEGQDQETTVCLQVDQVSTDPLRATELLSKISQVEHPRETFSTLHVEHPTRALTATRARIHSRVPVQGEATGAIRCRAGQTLRAWRKAPSTQTGWVGQTHRVACQANDRDHQVQVDQCHLLEQAGILVWVVPVPVVDGACRWHQDVEVEVDVAVAAACQCHRLAQAGVDVQVWADGGCQWRLAGGGCLAEAEAAALCRRGLAWHRLPPAAPERAEQGSRVLHRHRRRNL